MRFGGFAWLGQDRFLMAITDWIGVRRRVGRSDIEFILKLVLGSCILGSDSQLKFLCIGYFYFITIIRSIEWMVLLFYKHCEISLEGNKVLFRWYFTLRRSFDGIS